MSINTSRYTRLSQSNSNGDAKDRHVRSGCCQGFRDRMSRATKKQRFWDRVLGSIAMWEVLLQVVAWAYGVSYFPSAGCPTGFPKVEPMSPVIEMAFIYFQIVPFMLFSFLELSVRWKRRALSGWSFFSGFALVYPVLPILFTISEAITDAVAYALNSDPVLSYVATRLFFFYLALLLPFDFWPKLGCMAITVTMIYAYIFVVPAFRSLYLTFVSSIVLLLAVWCIRRDYVLHCDKNQAYSSEHANSLRFKHHRQFMVILTLASGLCVANMIRGSLRALLVLDLPHNPVVGFASHATSTYYVWCATDSIELLLVMLQWICILRLNCFCMDSVMLASDVESLSAMRKRLPELARTDGVEELALPAIQKQDLREGPLIGHGAYGAVYSCKVVRGPRFGAKYAVKKLRLRGKSAHERTAIIASLEREIDLLQHLKHERLVSYIGAIMEAESIWLIMDQFDKSLSGVIMERARDLKQSRHAEWFSAVEIAQWVAQLCEGVAYLHSQNVAHRDLKPENLLVELRGYNEVSGVFLCDFGVSKQYQGTGSTDAQHRARRMTQTACGTPGFAAPEALTLFSESYDPFLADVFGIGAIVFFMLTAEEPPTPLDQRRKESGPDGRACVILTEVVLRQYPVIAKDALARAGRTIDGNINHSGVFDCNTPILAELVRTCQECLSLDPSLRPAAAEIERRMETEEQKGVALFETEHS